jgi:hypothetical protein
VLITCYTHVVLAINVSPIPRSWKVFDIDVLVRARRFTVGNISFIIYIIAKGIYGVFGCQVK